jgi:hypothetical protein
MQPGVLERPLEAITIECAARHPILVLTGQLPAFLAVDVGTESLSLRFQRVGLVLLVGRDASVATLMRDAPCRVRAESMLSS